MSQNPYQDLPAERYWRRAVAAVPPFALDPTRPEAFTLTRSERIATAGSCFAQQVARVLRRAGFNFYTTELPPAGLSAAEEELEGNFSARYGNVYTTRQLVQLYERAFGHFRPRLEAWNRPDGRVVDPFRPRLTAAGFATATEVVAERDRHLAAVRTLFETLDTLVFTLGLTESWRDRQDGAALQLAPGVAGGEWDESRYVFANATVAEMTDDMLRFLDGLRAVNPSSRVVLTVSPVPIVATMEDRHVLVSNAFSKSALRVVADEVARARPNVFYFPSYEVVTGPATAGRYYDDNLRAVTPSGIDHVMRLFLQHTEGRPSPQRGLAAADLRLESARVAEVICDEEALDA